MKGLIYGELERGGGDVKRKGEKEKCWGAWFNGDEIGRKVG